jgi:inosine-uridine nucleoside N-ribohydrolase
LLWSALLLAWAEGPARELVVITDLEPDDRIALLLVAARFEPAEIRLVGTSGMHAGRKMRLLRQLLGQLGLGKVPAIQGSGGRADDYPDIASSRAARTYTDEGERLLPDSELATIDAGLPRSSDDLSKAIHKQLRRNAGTEILLLAPPTDLIKALEADPALANRIGHIHLMGGWTQSARADGGTLLRTSYNWNMAPSAAARLMELDGIPMTLYASDLVKASFAGGSINPENSPEVMATLQALRDTQPAVASFFVAADSWDRHVMRSIPALRKVIGANVGQQFTPADPMVVVGMTTPGLILRQRPVRIAIHVDDLDPARGFRVEVGDDARSRISLVDAIDAEAFRKGLIADLRTLGDPDE